jgi:hypothetical protein
VISPAPIQRSQRCAVCSMCQRKFEPCCCGIDQGSEHCWWCGAAGKPVSAEDMRDRMHDKPTGVA